MPGPLQSLVTALGLGRPEAWLPVPVSGTSRTSGTPFVGPVETPPEPPPLTGWRGAVDTGLNALVGTVKGVTGLGDQGPAGPTWTNAAALAAAVPLGVPETLLGAVAQKFPRFTKAILDSTHAARMERATAQGFTIDALHGRSGDYAEVAIPSWKRSADAGALGEGFYATPATEKGASIVEWYATQAGPQSNVMPLKLKIERPLVIKGTPGDDPRPRAMADLSKEWGLREQPRFSGSKQLNPDWAAEFSDALRSRGYDGVIADLGWANEYMVLSPQQVRSRFAAFDPAETGSADLLAGVLPPVALAGAASQQPQQPTEPAR